MQFSPRAVSASSLAAENSYASSPIKAIEARPNNKFALNDTYVAQADPVEVLKGWKIRLTATPSTGTSIYHWEKKEKQDTEWSAIGTGQVVECDASVMGDYQVRLLSDGVPSEEHRVIITDVTLVSFFLTAGSPYTLPSVHKPLVPGQDNDRPYEATRNGNAPTMSITGHVKAIKGAPATTKIAQGPIQGVEGSTYQETGCIWYRWYAPPATKLGDKIIVPITTGGINYPKIPLVNDAPNNKYLLAGATAVDINKEYVADDSPVMRHILDADIHRALSDPNNPASALAAGWFGLKNAPPATMKFTFTDWWVVGNKITNQWVPLKQQQWKLELDNTVPGNQAASIMGSPADPSAKPTDGSQTTIDNYKAQNISPVEAIDTKQ